MRMKSKIYFGIIGAALLLRSQSLFAQIIGTGSLYITAPGFSATGDQAGPYQVSLLTPATGVNPGSSFETFCLGTQIDYTPGSTYSYQISDTVQPSGSAPGGVGPPGFVTWGTAWLYSQYRAGAIGDGASNDPLNDALQEAIWTLQGQNTSGVTFSADPTDYADFLAAAANAAALAGVSDTSDASGAFGVYALDMLIGSSYVQPQLCIVPVPEPTTFLAGGLMLFPFGASAFRVIRKRLA
jgi:hypothetical protein